MSISQFLLRRLSSYTVYKQTPMFQEFSTKNSLLDNRIWVDVYAFIFFIFL